jgi:type I restriction enzyme M protein
MLSYLETIILLPYEVSYGFGQPTSVLIFGKKKRSASKKIRIIDASDAISDDANSIIRLNHHLNSIVNSENVRFLDEGFIKNTDHSRLESVFLDKFEGEPLENILVPIIGQSCHIDEQAKVLDRETFFKIDSLCVIKAKELPSIASEDSLKKIEQSCIILPSRWNARPVYFKFSGEPIYVPTSFDAFMIIKENVDPIFLITEISSNAVATQLNFLRKFGHETLLGWEDNRKVKIKLLSPESQKAKLAALEEVEAQIQILEEQLDAVRSGVNRGSFNEFASLKHTLGKPRLQISTWAANLTDFFKTNSDDAHLLNEKFQSAYETGIIDALGQIKDAVEFTTNMLEKGEHGLILEHYALERVSVDALAERIKKLVLGYKNFQIDFKPKDFGKLNLVLSNFNLDLFEVLLQNILVNAERHAFDPLEKGNKVVINLLDNFDTMIVEVKNNGRPFPKNYDRERFITKFRTSNKNLGTGLGGYDIDRIAKYFGNEDWDLDLSDSQYPVSFRFSFVLQTLKFDAKRGRKVTVPAIQRPSIGVTTPSRGKRSGAIASGNGRKGGTSAGRKS